LVRVFGKGTKYFKKRSLQNLQSMLQYHKVGSAGIYFSSARK